jgi:hypothetical protein
MSDRRPNMPLVCLMAVFAVSLALKLAVIHVGAPYVSVDDHPLFDGGFLVWFGNVAPQRVFIECWIAGLISVLTWVFKVVTHAVPGSLGLNIVADAYRDYYVTPDAYAHAYRYFVLAMDLTAAALVYRLARRALADTWRGWAAVLPAAMFLLSYNTIWADIVARPDAMLPLFMTAGLLMYYRSDFGRRAGWLLGAGFTLGLGAGYKLHLVFAVVFVLADLVRVHGLRAAVRLSWGFAALAALAFLIAAGIPLVDPLKYVKLRMANVKDDASPWIKWGEQFLAMVRGTGWLVLPLTLGAILHRGPASFRRSNPVAASLVFQSIGWLILFASIRQLRAYWMLPALPLFYVAAVGYLASVTRVRPSLQRAGAVVAGLIIIIMAGQSWREVRAFRASNPDGLRTWVKANVAKDAPFFIFGYDALILPRSTACMANIAAGIERGLASDRAAGLPFTARHVKNWEEEIELVRQDMLGGVCEEGYEFYSYYTTPFDKYAGIIDMGRMRYVMVQENFGNPSDYPLDSYLAENFVPVAETMGAGGRGYGLRYQIYERKASNEQ